MPDPYGKAHAKIRATRKLLAESRTQGFKYTNNVIDSIYGNLSTTERGLGRQLGAAQARQLSALQKLQSNAQAKNTRLVQGAQANVSKMYGSAIGAGTDFSGVKAQKKAGGLDAAGQARASGAIVSGNTAAVKIANAGVRQAEAGAKYATAEALAYRAKNDAQLIASQQFELQKMRLQNQLDLQNYRKKAAIDAEKDPTQQGAGTLAQSAGEMAIWFRQYYGGHPDASANEAYLAYGQAFPGVLSIDPDTGVAVTGTGTALDTLAQRVSTAEYGLQSSTDQKEEIAQVTAALQGLYPHFNKKENHLEGIIGGNIHDYWLTQAGAVLDGAAAIPDDPTYEAPISGPSGTAGKVLAGVSPTLAGAAAQVNLAATIMSGNIPAKTTSHTRDLAAAQTVKDASDAQQYAAQWYGKLVSVDDNGIAKYQKSDGSVTYLDPAGLPVDASGASALP